MARIWSSVRHAALAPDRPAVCSVPPPGRARMTTRLSPSCQMRMWSLAVSTTKWSGFTAPETTASQRPWLASMTAWRRRPLTWLAVKSTPAIWASTMRWITTAGRTVRWSMPLVDRYTTARSVHNDAQQCRTACSTASGPTTFK